MKLYTFRHLHKADTTWVKGPWIVEGPGVSAKVYDRTDGALITKRLNSAVRGLIWFCDNCQKTEFNPVHPDYKVGDCEQCIDCGHPCYLYAMVGEKH